MEFETDVSCSATEIVLPKNEQIENVTSEDTENSSVKSDDPYAYLERDDFTSEKFKIEIWGLPKFYGISQLRKLINDKLQLGCNKVKPMKPGSYWAYVCFRSEEDRVQALKVINGYKWKGNVLKAQNAKPCPDPLVKKRKGQGQGQTEGTAEGAIGKKSRSDKLPLEQRIKDTVSPYWNLPYPEQLSRKAKAIKGVLLRWAKEIQKLNPPLKTWLDEQRDKYQGLPCELQPVQPSPLITGYRNKCEFTIGVNEETGERTVGFRIGSYVDGSAGVAPVDNLDIVPAKMKQAAKIFENYVRSSSYGVFCPETHEGVWKQLMARLSTNEAFMLVVGIHPQNLSQGQLDALREDLRSFFVSGDGAQCKVNSLFLEHLPARSSGSSNSPIEHLFGDTCIYETVCDLSFRISPEAFFQVNTHGAEVLYKTIADLSKLSPKTSLLDVCCGTGTIGLCLSKHCGQVIGIELSKQAVEDAKANASRNKITNCEFFAGGAEDLLSPVIQRAVHDHVVAVVDPPRAGLHQKAMAILRNAKNLNKLVYVSCDPQAALNNLILLTRAKSRTYYRQPFIPVCAVPVDLFPHTNHCELVIYMERYNPPSSSDMLNSEGTNSSEAGGDKKEKSVALAMADEEAEQEVRRVLDALDVLQSMIDISADRLEGLRTQCATSAELTQQEIRTLEGKLIKLFSKQLVTKTKLEGKPLSFKQVPSLEQWLQVVGLSPDSIKCICLRVSTIESLQEKSEHELHVILSDRHAREEEVRRLSRALHNLKKYTDILLQGGQTGDGGNEPVLYWDSWDHRRGASKASGALSSSPRPPRAAVSSSSSSAAAAAASTSTAVTHASTAAASSSRPTRSSLPCAGGGGSANGDDDDPDDGCTCSCVSHSNSISSQAASLSASLSGSPTRLVAPVPLSPPPPVVQQHSVINHHQLHHHHAHHLYQQAPPPSPPPQPPLSSSAHYTPPSTPPVGKGGPCDRVKFPTTPPPCRRHQTGLAGALLPETYPLTKSKSHESQLGNRVDGEGGSGSEHGSSPAARTMRGRLPTEPGPNCTSDLGQMSPQLSSPIKSPPYCAPLDGDDNIYRTTLQVPKSPRTPTTINRGMGHTITHRFTKAFKVMATCDYCDKQMLFGTGLKCKECKFKCHRECEPKVPPSCGLPRDFLDYFSKTVQTDGTVFLPNQSPSMGRGSHSSSSVTIWPDARPQKHRIHSQQPINIPPFATGPDSSSNTSSCNSSTPSSPALMAATHTPQPAVKQQFNFPDVEHITRCGVTLETHPLSVAPVTEEVTETHRSNDSDRTVSGSGSASTDSERTPVRVDSQDSQVSDGEAVERPWPRQNSLSMREWDIPFDELKIGEPIGTGRFGVVYRGNWHGDVAIKLLNMDYLDDEKTLEAFKLEVATFRKTRHENLVLFMGACMKPPRLAIVTSMCKGMTLYTHIHLRKDKFNMNKTTIVAQQISQGMGYLHARGIVHKDLKSKNIFLENGKVVITDFGLFSVTKLCFGNRRGNGLSIPPGWLCYLSPEILRSLRVRQKHDEEELPFTQASDVYAFGTVWYELLCGEWPFKAQPPEAIIWQVGKGMKQSLANLQASRDVKDILMLCWSYRPGDRPDFARLLKTLEKLPKKRLARSPSHPIHLSRSAESVF